VNWFKCNREWILITLALALVAVAVISNIDFLLSEVFSIDNILRHMMLPTWLIVLIFLALYALKGAILVVSVIMLYIAAGMLFPTWAAILITYAGLTVSFSVGYFVGIKLGEEKVSRIVAKRKKISDFLRGNKENIVFFCFISRLLPMSYGLASLLFGALRVSFFKYLFMSLLGVSPRMIPIVLAGAAIRNPLSAEFLVPFSISLSITIIILVIYKTKRWLLPVAGANTNKTPPL